MKRSITLPTIVGILLLLSGVVFGVLGIRQGQSWFLRAAPEEQPKEVRITNVADNSFTVSWITDTAVRGFVKYGDTGGSLPELASDEKDLSQQNQGLYTIHYVNIRGLKPDTAYDFKIGSGKRIYDDSGKAFSLKTAPLINEAPGQTDLVSGKVDNAPEGSIAYFQNDSLTPLSTTIKSSGVFTISLSTARTKNLQKYYAGEDSVEQSFALLIEAGSAGRATVSVNMKNRDGLPPIAVPGDYTFLEELPRDEAGIILPVNLPTQAVASGVSPTPVPGSKFTFDNLPTPTESEEITLIYPGPLENIGVTNPEFQGAAPPGKTITITVQSTPQSEQIISNEDGMWTWTPPNNLEPGEHTLTVSYVDKFGVLKKLVRNFVVTANAAEGQSGSTGDLGFTATPSATLAPSPSPTPTIEASPTGSTTPTQTPSPIPTERAAMPATDSGMLEAGNFDITLMLTLAGVLLASGGFVLLSQSRKKT